MKASAVNSAGGSFCWNYATETFYGNYAGDKVCCIYAGFEVVLSVTVMLVDLSVAVMQVTVFIVIFIVIMQVTLSFIAMQVTVSSNNFIFISLLTASFHKIDQKTFKGIISGLHFTTFVNILPKLRHFEGRNYIQIGYKSYFRLFRTMV